MKLDDVRSIKEQQEMAEKTPEEVIRVTRKIDHKSDILNTRSFFQKCVFSDVEVPLAKILSWHIA